MKHVEKFLADSGYDVSFPMKDIRILFNCGAKDGIPEMGLITDLLVAEFKEGEVDSWPHHLHKRYTFDIGNASVSWKEKTPGMILPYLTLNYGFHDHKIRRKAFYELTKIEELREDMGAILYQSNNF